MQKDRLVAGLKAGGAPVMWERIIHETLPGMRRLVPPGSHVLEVGYGDGLLSCFLVDELGWNITGLDICKASYEKAVKHASECNLAGNVCFLCCTPEETRQHSGVYDAVFIKTVLYNAPNLEEYERWLEWILSILKPGGILVNFDTGKSNRFVQLYRRIRKREYTSLLLYTPEVEALFDARFEILERRYYGGWSQFLAPVPRVYKAAAWIEETVRKRDAGNCFAVGMIGRKGGRAEVERMRDLEGGFPGNRCPYPEAPIIKNL